MKLKKKVLLLVASVMVVGSVASVSAEQYVPFPTCFNYAIGTPTSTHHINQSVEIISNATPYVYARCDSYIYEGNQPVLTVTSGEKQYPTYSVSFTSKDTVGKGMKYTVSIPVEDKQVKFNGTVTNYSVSFTINASVEGK